jgi:hypothetical protein
LKIKYNFENKEQLKKIDVYLKINYEKIKILKRGGGGGEEEEEGDLQLLDQEQTCHTW